MNNDLPTQPVPDLEEVLPDQAEQSLLHQPKKLVIILAIVLFFLVISVVTYFIFFAPKESVNQLDLATTGTQKASDSTQVQKQKAKILDVSSAQQDLPSTDNLAPKVEKINSLSLAANQDAYRVNDSIEIIVNMQTEIEPDGVQFVILYDPQLLTNVGLEPINNFGSFIINEVDEQAGKIKAMLLKDPQETVAVNTNQPLLKITAQAVKAGKLSLTFDQEKTKIAAAAGQDVLKNVTNLTVDVN